MSPRQHTGQMVIIIINSPPGFTIFMDTSVKSCSKSLGVIEISLSPFNKKGLLVVMPQTRKFTGEGILSLFTSLLHVWPLRTKPLAGWLSLGARTMSSASVLFTRRLMVYNLAGWIETTKRRNQINSISKRAKKILNQVSISQWKTSSFSEVYCRRWAMWDPFLAILY